MKTKHLLLAAAMLLFTALTVVAQNAVDKKPAESNIPFSKKLPLPDIMNSSGNSSQEVMKADLNKLLMHAIKTHDKNAIKKALDDYRQQLKDKSNQQVLH